MKRSEPVSSAAQQLPDEPVPSVAAVPDPPRQRDAERTRAEILDVATQEFADRGYAGRGSTRSPPRPARPSG